MAKFWRKWLNMLVVNPHWSVVGSCQAAVGRSMAYEQPGIKDRAVKLFSIGALDQNLKAVIALEFFKRCLGRSKNPHAPLS